MAVDSQLTVAIILMSTTLTKVNISSTAAMTVSTEAVQWNKFTYKKCGPQLHLCFSCYDKATSLLYKLSMR